MTGAAGQAAIAICKPGVAYSEIGGVIEDIITKEVLPTRCPPPPYLLSLSECLFLSRI